MTKILYYPKIGSCDKSVVIENSDKKWLIEDYGILCNRVVEIFAEGELNMATSLINTESVKCVVRIMGAYDQERKKQKEEVCEPRIPLAKRDQFDIETLFRKDITFAQLRKSILMQSNVIVPDTLRIFHKDVELSHDTKIDFEDGDVVEVYGTVLPLMSGNRYP